MNTAPIARGQNLFSPGESFVMFLVPPLKDMEKKGSTNGMQLTELNTASVVKYDNNCSLLERNL